MRMSPAARWGTTSAMVASTAAAGTMSQTARGVSSFFTMSAIDVAPTAFAFVSSSTTFADLSKTTHRWPPAMSRSAMLAPMRPSPIIPICIVRSFAILRCSRVGCLEDALDGRVEDCVVFGVALLGGQPLEQRHREARDAAVVPPQAPISFFPRVSSRKRQHPHDLGMADEFGVEIVLLRQGDLEHDGLARRKPLELLEDGRFEQFFGFGFFR